jgi:hypothetical protein
MAKTDLTPVASAVLAIVVSAIAVALMLRQRREGRERSDDLSEADLKHFAHQDVRRFAGGIVMLLIAVGLLIGSRMIDRIDLNQRLFRRLLAGVWGGVFLLTFVLLVLAMFDISATRIYARRHRRAIAQERQAFLDAEKRRRAITGNGRGNPDPLGDAPPA